MSVPYTRAPHQGGPGISGVDSPHAALLIDFDNVTMGMRSDLSKELKNLLDSDVIKGKVSVQRAYADWRRYPQYIVPLSEASVDLIFAPAYGSSKKNATDIRMAIDALELIFIRPEIGTYILLTGDSDFSSLVLKLKEYGKYVIGVGIQESSSDILVQNCDEYYSYTSLTGLTKTTELSRSASDPWVLVKDAVAKMTKRGDVMRSDRLKQVMQEIDPTFDEGAIGFSKFSKFLSEANSRGLIQLKKLENGQYEVSGSKGRTGRPSRSDESRGRRDGGRGSRRGRGSGRGSRSAEAGDTRPTSDATDGDPLQDAYGVLTDALSGLKDGGRESVRDADVKRKILEQHPGFDESNLGFPKFSLFLAQAEEHGVVRLARTEAGDIDVSLGDGQIRTQPSATTTPDVTGPSGTVIEVSPPAPDQSSSRLGPRRGSTRRRTEEEKPSLLGRLFGLGSTSKPTTSDPPPADAAAPPAEASTPQSQEAPSPTSSQGSPTSSQGSPTGPSELQGLGLPSDPGAIVRYMTHRYKGVGEKTAETLVERFGSDLFATMQSDPGAIAKIVPAGRAEQVLDAWKADYERRFAVMGDGGGRVSDGSGDSSGGGSTGRGRSRGRGRG
jgi:uncharacterized protein (TIGR00288 family)